MTGRTACTLQRDTIRHATCTRIEGKSHITEYNDEVNKGRPFFPRYNQAPTHYLPVLVSKAQFDDDADPRMRVLCSMRWGLVPSWHKGDPNDYPFKTINARVETVLEKKTFSVPLKQGRRCVVVCEGYFQWEAPSFPWRPKQAFFVFRPQRNVIYEERDWYFRRADKELEEWWDDSKQKWKGPKLLMIAAIYDVHRETGLHSFAIITVESSEIMSQFRQRMPAILATDSEVERWLNFKKVDIDKAIKMLKPCEDLAYYPVDRQVGNPRFNLTSCVKPLTVNPEGSADDWPLEHGEGLHDTSEDSMVFYDPDDEEAEAKAAKVLKMKRDPVAVNYDIEIRAKNGDLMTALGDEEAQNKNWAGKYLGNVGNYFGVGLWNAMTFAAATKPTRRKGTYQEQGYEEEEDFDEDELMWDEEYEDEEDEEEDE